MKAIVIAGVALAMSVGVSVQAGDEPAVVRIPPTDVTVKVQAPAGTSDADIAAAIASENAQRDPVAQQAAQVAKRQADRDAAHTERVSKICDSIPEQAMANDPSLRRMCR